MRIHCPKCGWKPRGYELWSCAPGCRHQWHTFDTGGKCPKCGKIWRVTACHACHQWSPHEDWYHDEPPIETRTEEKELALVE